MAFDIKSESLKLSKPYCFDKKGLHVISLTACEYKNNMEFTLISGDYSVSSKIRKAIERVEDNVSVGSGDLI